MNRRQICNLMIEQSEVQLEAAINSKDDYLAKIISERLAWWKITLVSLGEEEQDDETSS